MGILRLSVLVAAAAALLPAYLRVGAFVLPATPTRGVPSVVSSSSSRRATSAPSSISAEASSSSGVEEAKSNLKRALADSKGSTLAKDVVAAVEALSELNPTADPGRAWSLNCGEWVSIGEDFKGTTRTADGLECTLGRLVFDIFEPVKMPVLITSIENNLGPRPAGASSADESAYETVTHFVARDGSGLRGIVVTKGIVAEDPSDPKCLVVKFTVGTIEPKGDQDLDSWSKVIGLKDRTGKDSKGPLSSIKGIAKGLMLKLAFGFRGPADKLGSRGELSYEMKRSPSSVLNILYIDDEMRVTRGGQGALVVVTRR